MSFLKKSPWISFINCGGCIPGDTMMIFQDGSILTAEELIEDELEAKDYHKLGKDEVLARSIEAGTLTWDGFSPKDGKIITAYKLPSKGELVEIWTSTTKLKLTPDHEVLVDSNEGPIWKKAELIEHGDHLFSPSKLEIKNENQLPHVLEWLPETFLARLNPETKEEIRQKLKKKFGNLRKAADELGTSYKRLTHSVEGLSVKEIKSIAKETDINLLNISKNVQEVVKGTEVAKISTKDIDSEFMYALGLIASDGCISVNKKGKRPSYKIRFDNNEKVLIDMFIDIIKKWTPGAKIRTEKVGNLNRVHAYHFPFAYLTYQFGLKGLDRTKEDLRPIFKLSEDLIASFIAGFFDGDGSIVLMKRNESNQPRISVEFAIKDYQTAKMIQLLLKRLGIVNKIIASINRSGYGTKTMHSVRITTDQDILRFLEKISIKHPKKLSKIKSLKSTINKKKRGNTGKIHHAPLSCGKMIKNIREQYNFNRKELFDPTFLSMIENGKRVEKSTVERICDSFEKKLGNKKEIKELRKLISNDYYLDPVKKIIKIKSSDKFVYNFNVSETHKYIPEGAFVISNCNGCTLECIAVFNPRYDVTRFGMELKPSAKHADVLLVTGIVNKQMKKRLLNIYEQMANPKVVVAVGACAVSNGLYKDSYNTAGPLDKVLKVNAYVPGCPPRPEAIIDGILMALSSLDKKKPKDAQVLK
jgi:Ni,Fe-hydrogenase III small subunit